MTELNLRVVQFVRPNGHQREGWITINNPGNPDLEALYEEMKAAGCRFEAEVLPLTGEVYLTISDKERSPAYERGDGDGRCRQGSPVSGANGTWSERGGGCD